MWPFKPKPTQLKIQVIGKVPTKLTLDDFRSDPEMVRAANDILANPMFQLMMQVNRNSSPALMAFREDVSLEARAMHQTKIEGFNMSLKNFEAMGVSNLPPEQLAATFEEEERRV